MNMLRVLVEAARHEGNPLLKLSNTMKWQISFGDHEITELERYLEIIGPLEEMFNSLNSTQSTIQRVIPSIKVNTSILKLLFVDYIVILIYLGVVNCGADVAAVATSPHMFSLDGFEEFTEEFTSSLTSSTFGRGKFIVRKYPY